MTAQEFWIKFKEIFIKNKDAAIKFWASSKEYTTFILGKIASFLKEQEFETSKEYYRIDLTGWKQLKGDRYKLLKDKDFENYLWDLEVAVEHENNDKSWMDEVVKLMHINCPLRIVIGYLPLEENKQIYISALNAEIKKVKTYDNMKNGEFLLIIGDSKCKNDKEKFCHYTPYIFKDDGFKQV